MTDTNVFPLRPKRRNVLSPAPTGGQVKGSALYGDVVIYGDDEISQYAMVIRTGLAGGLFRLRDYNTGEEFTDALTDERWEFHGKPNGVQALTMDHTGETLRSTISCLPRFTTVEMITRMAIKRHFVKVGRPGELISFHWVHVPGRQV